MAAHEQFLASLSAQTPETVRLVRAIIAETFKAWKHGKLVTRDPFGWGSGAPIADLNVPKLVQRWGAETVAVGCWRIIKYIHSEMRESYYSYDITTVDNLRIGMLLRGPGAIFQGNTLFDHPIRVDNNKLTSILNFTRERYEQKFKSPAHKGTSFRLTHIRSGLAFNSDRVRYEINFAVHDGLARAVSYSCMDDDAITVHYADCGIVIRYDTEMHVTIADVTGTVAGDRIVCEGEVIGSIAYEDEVLHVTWNNPAATYRIANREAIRL